MSEKQSLIPMDRGGLQLRALEDAYRFAKCVVQSGLAPQGDNPEAVVVKLQAGAELGFKPMQALASLAVVNGRACLMGSAILALVRSSGRFHHVDTGVEGEDDQRAGYVAFHRKGDPEPVRVTFSVAEAKKAKLWGKVGRNGPTPWVTAPDDMLIWRAVARASKQYWSDITMGVAAAEEVRDYAIPPAAPEPITPLSATVVEGPPANVDPLLASLRPQTDASLDAVVVEPEPTPEPETSATPPTRCPECNELLHDPDDGFCRECGVVFGETTAQSGLF